MHFNNVNAMCVRSMVYDHHHLCEVPNNGCFTNKGIYILYVMRLTSPKELYVDDFKPLNCRLVVTINDVSLNNALFD